ncbi:MAG: signal peptide peptidase SppA [Bacteroidales bacterium]|nr:signal peptide peptidase SppA [Bacteroidales bacterium]
MKHFLSTTLATIVGLLISGLLFFFILFAVIAAMSSADKTYDIKPKSILTINLSGALVEQGQDNPFDLAIPGMPIDPSMQAQGLDDILAAIKKAGEEDHIKGIYLKAGALQSGFASAEMIRNALIDFKAKGKFIVAYGDTYDQRDYYICSTADKVFLNPGGLLNWCGLAANPVYFSKTLDKLGVEMQVFKVGTFKSAVEPYISTKMSPENRLQTTEYLEGIWASLLAGVSESRALSVDTLNLLADENQLLKPATDILKARMVDSLAYENGVKDYLAAKLDIDKRKDLNMVSVSECLAAPAKVKFVKNKIAVLYAEGDIVDDGGDGITPAALIKEIDDIRDNDNVKAVVFRINSPGGSAYASEQIWEAIGALKAEKPVVVSMGNLAASGGYYIACNATKIVASPMTLTGSIGIFGLFPMVEKLTDKIGLSFDVVKTNAMSDFGVMVRPMSAPERQKMQQYIDNGYELFVKRCAEGRSMTPEAIKNIAEGRVWTGAKAVELGLVDELGSLDKAVEVAAGLAKVTDYQLSYYPEKKDFFTVIMESFTEQTKLKVAMALLGEEYAPFVKLKAEGIQTGVLARMNEISIR